jgi:hypothetical protein
MKDMDPLFEGLVVANHLPLGVPALPGSKKKPQDQILVSLSEPTCEPGQGRAIRTAGRQGQNATERK